MNEVLLTIHRNDVENDAVITDKLTRERQPSVTL